MARSASLKRDTRELIVKGFCAKVRTAPLSKLRIADLINELNINRNTFYYYFSGKDEIAFYAFRSDLDRRLRAILPESELVTVGPEGDPFEGLAYYARTELGARNLDHSAFIHCLMECAVNDRALYRNLFTLYEHSFMNIVRAYWRYAVRTDIDLILDGRYMADEVKDMLVGFASNSIIGAVTWALDNTDKTDIVLDERYNPFENIILESIRNAIQKHPLTRVATPGRPSTGAAGRPTFSATSPRPVIHAASSSASPFMS